MSGDEIPVKDAAEVAERMTDLRDRVREAIAESVAVVIEDTIMAESQAEVPKKSGNLANSMEPLDVQITGNGVSFTIFYDCEYALYVHEIPRQNYTTPGTKYKFLEDPVNRNLDKISDAIVEQIDGILRGEA